MKKRLTKTQIKIFNKNNINTFETHKEPKTYANCIISVFI